jgi:ATP-binding cassette, subfamily B, bacterial MsbA
MKKLYFKYLRLVWTKLAIILLLSFAATIFITLKPIVVAGIIDTTLKEVGYTSSQSANQTQGLELDSGLFNLNDLGSNVKNIILGDGNKSIGTVSSLVKFVLILIVLALLGSIFKYSADVLNSFTRNQVMRLVRYDLFESMITMSLGFFHRQKSGELISRIVTDSMAFSQGIVSVTHRIFHSSLLVLVYGVFLFNTSVVLTFSIILIFLGHYGISAIIKKPVRKMEEGIYDSSANLSVALQESFTNMRVIKSFGSDKNEKKKLNNNISESSDAYFKAQAVGYIEPEARYFLDSFAEAAILLIAIVQLLKGGLNMQGFLLYVYVTRLIMMPLNQFATYFVWIQRIKAAYKRIGDYFSQKPDVIDGAIKKASFNSEIVVSNISFIYDKTPVIKDISFTLYKGEVLAMVGSSGGGKSTLTDLILRFYDPQEGQITIDGINLKDVKMNRYRQIFGVVPQESLLFNDTIENNIQYGREWIDSQKIKAAAMIANAHDFILEMPKGYSTLVGDRGVRLSGGQRQRISIARAVAGDPEILIFDEATSSLDTDSERQVQLAIEKILKNSTAIVIAHRLSTVLNADRILVIDKGRIEAEGNHKELLERSSIYRRLYEMQFENRDSLELMGNE